MVILFEASSSSLFAAAAFSALSASASIFALHLLAPAFVSKAIRVSVSLDDIFFNVLTVLFDVILFACFASISSWVSTSPTASLSLVCFSATREMSSLS